MGGKAPSRDQQWHNANDNRPSRDSSGRPTNGQPADAEGNYGPPQPQSAADADGNAPPPRDPHSRNNELQSVDAPADTRSDAQKMADFARDDPEGYKKYLEQRDQSSTTGKIFGTGATILATAINPFLGAGMGAVASAGMADSDRQERERRNTIANTTPSAPNTGGTVGNTSGAGGSSTSAVNPAGASALADQTRANRPTQNTPFGFTNWTTDANGNPVQNTGLSGNLQGANDALQQQAKANALRGVGTGEDARNQAITGAYNQATSRLDPQWAQRDEHLASALANQGLDPNSQAYRNAMLQQSQSRNDAYGSAMNSAIGQGTAAQQATFNENVQGQQLPYQQMGALHGLSQPFGFNAAGRVETPNLDAQASLLWDKQKHGETLSAEETTYLLKALTAGGSAAVSLLRSNNSSGAPSASDPGATQITGYDDNGNPIYGTPNGQAPSRLDSPDDR